MVKSANEGAFPASEEAPAPDHLAANNYPTVVAKNLRVRYNVPSKPKPGVRDHRKRLAWPRRQKVTVAALRGVSLSVSAGEFIGIIGRNGSGKSTLLRCLAGVETPSSGGVFASSRPSLLGVNAALIPELSGAENVRLGCLAMGMTPAQATDAYAPIVELSGVDEAIDLPMRTYSSGMGSRLKFAISLASAPSILMIDEALATGDATFTERAERAMNDMLKRAGTVFLVNHAAQTIENMCTRAIWLEKGQIILDGDAVYVAQKYRWFAHNLAIGKEDIAGELLQQAISEGARLKRLSEPGNSVLPEQDARRSLPRERASSIAHDSFSEALVRAPTRKAFPTSANHALPVTDNEKNGRN